MISPDKSGHEVSVKILGWRRLLTRLSLAAIAYCIVFHILSPVQPDQNLATETGRFTSVFGAYLSVFIPVYIVISVIMFISVKIFLQEKAI
jgi:hypothetical protein